MKMSYLFSSNRKVQYISSFCLCSLFFFVDAAVVCHCAVVHSKDSTEAFLESLWWAGEISATSCCLLAGSDSSKVCFAHASPSVQNFRHKEMGGFKKNVSPHHSLQNLRSTWEIMAVVCDNGRINCQKWGLVGLKGTEKNPCRNVCIFSERDTFQRSIICFSLCGKPHAICSLWNEFAFRRNAMLCWKCDMESQCNPPHWCNQSNGTRLKPNAGDGFSPKHSSSSRPPLCRQPDSCVLRALCQLLWTRCTVTLDAAA